MTSINGSALLAASALLVIGVFAPGSDDWTGTENQCDDVQAVTGAQACVDGDGASSDYPVLDIDIPIDLGVHLD